MFEIDRNSKVLLVDQIRSAIISRIEAFQWVRGSRLPSVRALAKQLGVSIFTVSSAYEDLVAQQIIESRPGAGYYILASGPADTSKDLEKIIPPSSLHAGFLYRALDPSQYDTPVSSGYLPPSWLADAVPASVTGRLIRNTLSCSVPAPAAGSQELRSVIAKKLRELQINASSTQIVVTIGATHAFSLIRSVMLQPGDYLLVEDPSYLLLQLKLIKDRDFNIITVPRTADGPDLEAMEAIVAEYRPKLFLTQTLIHNPTGGNTSPAKGFRILSLAQKYDFHIVEDDIFGALCTRQMLRLASLDEWNRTFYLSGFSKVLSPALRLGYVVAPPAFVERLIEQKMYNVLCGSSIDETIVAYTLESGRYQHHLDALRQRVMQERIRARDWLGKVGVESDEGVAEGLFIWARFPAHVDLRRLVEEAHDARIFLAPGSLFSNTREFDQYIRLNVSHCNDLRFRQFLDAHLCSETASA
ncbi:aminotransferase-like domain-containing protein [Pseudomonas sp. Marseille-P9899]|uniref:aminotransferase-like domain-containing protein n=1 Tax=Pseudomonas sp. Marseille-P9899 TaxID=2730401 RepID=UPI00158992A4|nr:PLP-dependent aminotransferase family protein [Pseudomonas sp. Marseille-P9899]